MRLVREATAKLTDADRLNDEDGMVEAILELSALGIDLDQIEQAQSIASQMARD